MSMYFENDKEIKSNKHLISIKIKEEEIKLYVDNGVFSKDKLDYGTRLLLETIIKNDINGNILDLGCGYGPVGIYLAKKTNYKQIDMVDVNERALQLSKENVKINNIKNVNVFTSNIYENITSKYDYIVTNPPIRAGKETIRKFLYGAKDYLNKDGQLWFVMRKDHGVKTMVKELEEIYNVEILEKDKGFYIVRCLLNN